MEHRTLASLEAEFQQWLARVLEHERQRLATEIAEKKEQQNSQTSFRSTAQYRTTQKTEIKLFLLPEEE